MHSKTLLGLKLTRVLVPLSVLLVLALTGALLAALLPAQADHTGARVTMDPNSANMVVGEIKDFNVELDVNGLPDIIGAQFLITFDPNAVEVLAARPRII